MENGDDEWIGPLPSGWIRWHFGWCAYTVAWALVLLPIAAVGDALVRISLVCAWLVAIPRLDLSPERYDAIRRRRGDSQPRGEDEDDDAAGA